MPIPVLLKNRFIDVGVDLMPDLLNMQAMLIYSDIDPLEIDLNSPTIKMWHNVTKYNDDTDDKNLLIYSVTLFVFPNKQILNEIKKEIEENLN